MWDSRIQCGLNSGGIFGFSEMVDAQASVEEIG